MRDDPTVVALVAGARDGDKAAWDRLVERYAPLVWSTCRRYGLTEADAEDVGQGVWLRLVERLDSLRDPAALAGWLATTTRRECVRVLRERKRHALPVDPVSLSDSDTVDTDARLLREELEAALRDAFAALPTRCQALLSLLMRTPPVPYGEIAARLGMAVGAIGPNRARCLARLRRHPPLAAFMEPAAGSGEGGFHV